MNVLHILLRSVLELRRIGPLSVSYVGLGCNNFAKKLDEKESARVVEAALDAEIDFFDTADVYGKGDHSYSAIGRSEELLGQALGPRRDRITIATKFGISMSDSDVRMQGGGRRWVQQACEDSLRRLQTDYIDLYQLHRPDSKTPIGETLETLGDLVDQGKVRVIGCSNFTAEQLREAETAASDLGLARFESVQNEYSLLSREAEQDVLPLCEELGIAFLPYFPLASGLLTGKYVRGAAAPSDSRLAFWKPRSHHNLEDEVMDRVEALSDLARTSGRSLLELAFSWLLARPQIVSVIAGATTPEQVRSNVAAAAQSLSKGELAAIQSI